MSTAGAATFVGRIDELQRLREFLAGMDRGHGALVLLEGEAGAGKSRLSRELQPAAVVEALEYASAPYAPIRDLVATLDRRFPKILKSNTELAQAMATVLDLRAPDGKPGYQRKLLDALVSALDAYGAIEPLVIVVEDVHWIDAASADVLIHLARNIQRSRILLIATFRGAEAEKRDESRAFLARLSRYADAALSLAGLSRDESMLLINEASPQVLPLAVRRSICDLAQGSPLLILELTRHVAADPKALHASVPISVQALVHERLHKFDDSDRDVLRVCAAMEIFDPPMVREIANISLESVMATLRKARNAAIIAEDGDRFVFRHALIRRAVTDDLLAIELSQLHARIAERLESHGGSPQVD